MYIIMRDYIQHIWCTIDYILYTICYLQYVSQCMVLPSRSNDLETYVWFCLVNQAICMQMYVFA